MKLEILMSRELALKLGCLSPRDLNDHRGLKVQPMLRVRDPVTMAALFWPIIPGVLAQLTPPSST